MRIRLGTQIGVIAAVGVALVLGGCASGTTGTGATMGAAGGTLIGADTGYKLGGTVGALFGAAVGAVTGGLAGDGLEANFFKAPTQRNPNYDVSARAEFLPAQGTEYATDPTDPNNVWMTPPNPNARCSRTSDGRIWTPVHPRYCDVKPYLNN